MLNIAKKIKKYSKSRKIKEARLRCTCNACSQKINTLFESKADTQRLIDFAGEDLANRFLAIKDKLKAPQNDLYYWIKNHTVEEFEQAVIAAENTKSNRQQARDIADQGAKLVCDSAHWKVYHITTYAASQKYGRDTEWCITGVNNYGDQYWKSYTSQGIQFYFLITKGKYNSRGYDSKFAIALYPGNAICEVFNQQDDQIVLDDIPHISEVTIPGIDLNALESHYEYECYACGTILSDDEYYIGDDGHMYCIDCIDDEPDDRYDDDELKCCECGEVISTNEYAQSIYGDYYCDKCWNDIYVDTDEYDAESFMLAADDPDYFDDWDRSDINKEVLKMVKVWTEAKAHNSLNLTAEEIAEIERGFINTASKYGITIEHSSFTEKTESLKEPYRRIVARGAILADNELFIDFE
jgi:hypothetical protein